MRQRAQGGGQCQGVGERGEHSSGAGLLILMVLGIGKTQLQVAEQHTAAHQGDHQRHVRLAAVRHLAAQCEIPPHIAQYLFETGGIAPILPCFHVVWRKYR